MLVKPTCGANKLVQIGSNLNLSTCQVNAILYETQKGSNLLV
jgi:hypothetical protein